MKKILFTLLAVLALTGCNAQNKNEKMVNEQMKKCLVVFFSHAGENYSVGNIQVGNTKITPCGRSQVKYKGTKYNVQCKRLTAM